MTWQHIVVRQLVALDCALIAYSCFFSFSTRLMKAYTFAFFHVIFFSAEPGPSGLQFSKEGSSTEQTQETPKSGRRKRSSVHTPRTKKKLLTLHSRSERYRKALGRMRKRHKARRVTQQEALNKLEPDLPKDLFELLKAQIRLGTFPK